MKTLRLLALVFSIAVIELVAVIAMASHCDQRANYLEVDLNESQLYLCSNLRSMKSYPVSFGRGGTDKHIQGDSRTPIGRYRLGAPHASERFFIFIPIGYPTAAQRAQGYTGASVGVHGPLNYLNWVGSANTWINWTDGCIAVGTEEEISEISNWVRQGHIGWIVIH